MAQQNILHPETGHAIKPFAKQKRLSYGNKTKDSELHIFLKVTVSLIIHELLLLFVSSTTLIFMNYAPNMKV